MNGRRGRHAWAVLFAAAVIATLVADAAALFWGRDPAVLWMWLRPGSPWLPSVILLLWAAALTAYALPGRREGRPLGVLLVAGLALIAIVGGLASYLPWSGDADVILTPLWRTLRLFAGDAPWPTVDMETATVPIALEVARLAAIAATFVTAALAALVLWRRQVDRARARFLSFDDVVIGADDEGVALVERLVADVERQGRIGVVVSPRAPRELLHRLSTAGAFVVVADPTSGSNIRASITRPVVRHLLQGSWRPILSVERIYILHPEGADAQAIHRTVRSIANEATALPDRALQVIVRAGHSEQAWRIRLRDILPPDPALVVDAIAPAEVTAAEVVGRALQDLGPQPEPRTLIVCGDTDLTAAILTEADRRYREARFLRDATSVGRAKGTWDEGRCLPAGRPLESLLAHDDRELLTTHWAFDRVVVIDRAAGAITDAHRLALPADAGPEVTTVARPWQDALLPTLNEILAEAEDAGPGAGGSADVAVVVADPPTPRGWQAALRCSRLTAARIWYNAGLGGSDGQSTPQTGLHEFDVSLLFLGWLPDTTWSRIGRLVHEAYRRRDLSPLSDCTLKPTRLPWWHRDQSRRLELWRRRDNIDQARGVMRSIQDQGYTWVPVGSQSQGAGFRGDWTEVARAEHARWLAVQLQHGYHADDSPPADPDNRLQNKSCVQWEDLPESGREWTEDGVKRAVEAVAVVGYVPMESTPATHSPR